MATGNPVDQPSLFRMVRRVAKGAGIPQAEELFSHSVRHTIVTILYDRGLRDPHHPGSGRAHDPRTTRRSDLERESLDRSPANDLGAIFAAGTARHAAQFRAAA